MQPHAADEQDEPVRDEKPWTFLTNHTRTMIVIAEDPEVRLRDIAVRIGITERAVQRIVAELEEAGYLTHDRIGRRNRYRIQPGTYLRHELDGVYQVKNLLDLFVNR